MNSKVRYSFDLGLLIAYNLMCFEKNVSENKDGKTNEDSYLSCVTNGEFYFTVFNSVRFVKLSQLNRLRFYKLLLDLCLIDHSKLPIQSEF